MIRTSLVTAIGAAIVAAGGCASCPEGCQCEECRESAAVTLAYGVRADAEDDDGDEVEIPLSEVPELVRQAGAAAVPGIVFEEAERETEDGTIVYCLEGEANGVDYEVEVTSDGTVLETEQEADDDDDDD